VASSGAALTSAEDATPHARRHPPAVRDLDPRHLLDQPKTVVDAIEASLGT
jgi:hypothetical protein